MQDLLTIAATTVLFAAPAYLATMFVLGFTSRHRTAPVTVQPIALPEKSDSLSAISAPQISDTVVPFIRPISASRSQVNAPQSSTDWSALDPHQLRKECQSRGIVWRNAHGKNRHLKKSEMIDALNNLQRAA